KVGCSIQPAGTNLWREHRAAGGDFAEQPVVEAAREQPFEALAAPEQLAPLDRGALEVFEKRGGAPRVGGEQRVRAHRCEPGANARQRIELRFGIAPL